MEPDHYRKRLITGVFWHGDVQVKAVFAHATFAEGFVGRVLGRLIGPGNGFTHTTPAFVRNRWLPAQVPQWRFGVGNAVETPRLVIRCGKAPHNPQTGGDDLAVTLGPGDKLYGIVGIAQPAGAGIGIVEYGFAAGVQFRHQVSNNGAAGKLRGGLIQCQPVRVGRQNPGCSPGNINTVVEVAILIDGLDQDSQIGRFVIEITGVGEMIPLGKVADPVQLFQSYTVKGIFYFLQPFALVPGDPFPGLIRRLLRQPRCRSCTTGNEQCRHAGGQGELSDVLCQPCLF